MKIALATDPSGAVGHTWGKARTVAVATVRDGSIVQWDEFDVRWDEAHDLGTHGAHHARVATFLREHQVCPGPPDGGRPRAAPTGACTAPTSCPSRRQSRS